MPILEDLLSYTGAFALAYWIANKQLSPLAKASQSHHIGTSMSSSIETPRSCSRHDVYHVAFLLQQKLPPELVPQIMDQAEYWLKSTVSLQQYMEVSDIRIIGRRDEYLCPGVTYVSTLPIGEYPGEEENGIAVVGHNPVRKVVFTIDSQDQGWSSYPNDYGTERRCWTWFEAVVRELSQPVYQDVVRAHQESGSQDAVEPPPQGREVLRNLHALRQWRSYTRAWSILDDDEEVRQWVSDLKRGQVIDLTVWAKYVGWRNRVRGATIDVYSAAVR